MTAAIQLILVGRPGTAFRTAAAMAAEAGAQVRTADTTAQALEQLRAAGAGLAMVDVEADISGFLRSLRAERFALPVIACGIDAPAAAAAAAIRAGARDYLPLPPDRELIAAAILSVAAEPSAEMIGADPVFARATGFALAVASARAPVLIAGEPGTGKELLARAVHAASGRAGPLVTVDCAASTPDVIASELWGHEAGAFPGATAPRAGGFDVAAGGTLLLRHVEALDAAAQTRLAASLRDPADTRLIATAGEASDGLRPDLLARLSLVRAVLPPLRARGGDVALLARTFAERFARANEVACRPLTYEALALLSAYAWPGNVRELEDMIHRAVLLARGAEIGADDLVRIDGAPLTAAAPEPAPEGVGTLVGQTVEAVERELILRTLERCRGNRTSASTILGISVRTMRNKLRLFIEAGHPVAPAA